MTLDTFDTVLTVKIALYATESQFFGVKVLSNLSMSKTTNKK